MCSDALESAIAKRLRINGGTAKMREIKKKYLRELRLTAAAVPTREVAMSTPLLPMPTTTTRLPSKA
jgi:hypothetical protein